MKINKKAFLAILMTGICMFSGCDGGSSKEAPYSKTKKATASKVTTTQKATVETKAVKKEMSHYEAKNKAEEKAKSSATSQASMKGFSSVTSVTIGSSNAIEMEDGRGYKCTVYGKVKGKDKYGSLKIMNFKYTVIILNNGNTNGSNFKWK